MVYADIEIFIKNKNRKGGNTIEQHPIREVEPGKRKIRNEISGDCDVEIHVNGHLIYTQRGG